MNTGKASWRVSAALFFCIVFLFFSASFSSASTAGEMLKLVGVSGIPGSKGEDG